MLEHVPSHAADAAASDDAFSGGEDLGDVVLVGELDGIGIRWGEAGVVVIVLLDFCRNGC